MIVEIFPIAAERLSSARHDLLPIILRALVRLTYSPQTGSASYHDAARRSPGAAEHWSDEPLTLAVDPDEICGNPAFDGTMRSGQMGAFWV